jgi:hypothetical protein
VELIVELADQLAIKYIDGIIMILKKVPKLKNKSDSDLKHISLTIYYTLTVGLIMKLVKLLMLKKGMVGDTAAYKSIRDIITNGLKFGSYDLDFDDMERESDIMFSNKSLAPIVKELTDRVGSMLHIFEDQSVSYRDFYKDLLLELEFNVAPYSEHPHGFIGWKGKMVWMSPDKFLSLARKLDFPYEDSLNSLRNAMKDGKSIPHLMLGVDMVKRKVIDHEGRHRATVAKELGIEKVPVFIYTGNYTRTPSWTKEDHDVVDNLKFDREG